jgi:hypothetical protein
MRPTREPRSDQWGTCAGGRRWVALAIVALWGRLYDTIEAAVAARPEPRADWGDA